MSCISPTLSRIADYFHNAQRHNVIHNAKQATGCEDGERCSHMRRATHAMWRQPSALMAVLIPASMAMAPLVGANGYHSAHHWCPV